MTAVIIDSNSPLLTESTAVLNKWTQYGKDMYKFQLRTDPSKQPDYNQWTADITGREGGSLKRGKLPSADNIPRALLKQGEEETTQPAKLVGSSGPHLGV